VGKEKPEESLPEKSYIVPPTEDQAPEKAASRESAIPIQANREPLESDSNRKGTDVQIAQARSKGYGVEVRLTSPKIVEVEPGKIVTATFQITNNTEREEEFFDALSRPTGWQMITPLTPFSMKPFGRQFKIIAFSVPADAPGGRYPLVYSVRSQRDYGIADSDTFSVVVLSKTKVEMMLMEKPQSVIAGDPFPMRVRI
jgi:hypothetical protein